jgi:Uma2 family endonuclease
MPVRQVPQTILPLENGDKLTRTEFERRYEAMPHVKKAELIEGIVYMASPVRFKRHGRPHARMMAWLTDYWIATPGVEVADNTTVRLDVDNEPQPDALLRIEGGQSSVSEDDYIEGAPELMVEVAASSASYDLRDKLSVYRRNRVQEYLVWQIYDRQLNWFRWREGEYILLKADGEGIVRSEVFPGLWLSVPALLEGNLLQIRRVLDLGLATAEHLAFVERLAMSAEG